MYKFKVFSTSVVTPTLIGYEWFTTDGRWMHQHIDQPVSEGQCLGWYQRKQFTGRQDLNNEDLYDGDIVEIFGVIAEVRWSDVWSGWIFFCHSKPEGQKDLPFSNGNGVSNCNSAVKKGNIFENQEFLKC